MMQWNAGWLLDWLKKHASFLYAHSFANAFEMNDTGIK